jgi:hypothetical protein
MLQCCFFATVRSRDLLAGIPHSMTGLWLSWQQGTRSASTDPGYRDQKKALPGTHSMTGQSSSSLSTMLRPLLFLVLWRLLFLHLLLLLLLLLLQLLCLLLMLLL